MHCFCYPQVSFWYLFFIRKSFLRSQECGLWNKDLNTPDTDDTRPAPPVPRWLSHLLPARRPARCDALISRGSRGEKAVHVGWLLSGFPSAGTKLGSFSAPSRLTSTLPSAFRIPDICWPLTAPGLCPKRCLLSSPYCHLSGIWRRSGNACVESATLNRSLLNYSKPPYFFLFCFVFQGRKHP